MEQQPAAQRAEYALQTHDEACNGGVYVPLAQDLQGIGHAAGHHAAVDQREPVGPELGQGGILEQEGGSGALYGHHKELQQAQADTVHLRGKVVHRHDLKAEQHGAGKQDPIAGLNAAKAVFHAEQIEPAHGDDHAQPEPGTAPPPQKQPEYRHQHHIHGGQETGLGRGRVERDADLLGSGTLALIVNRQKEIDNFVSEPYWVLATIYRDTQFTATSGKFTSKEEGEKAFSTIAGKPFTVTDVSKKKGNEAPPHLYDLTSLQVDCNKKFAYSADITLKLIQSLYEKKYTTYPRVDTQFLTDDIYPKCPQILNGVSQAKIMSQQKYLPLIQQLATISKKLPKSKKVFDNSKVTDHHAIIPTGVPPTGLTDMEANVYDLIAKRFISVFYPDCKFSTTTVLGEVINEDGPKPEKIEFKVSGKEILEPGWRVVYAKDAKNADDDDASDNANGNADSGNGAKKEVVEERTLPSFTKGESGEHQPTLTEKWTTPPKYYTEATLLRAMETAGKFVEDEELRAALKENGIGRPSSRAGIIETLFKRHYIRRQRKNLMATPTGIELIDTIHEELLKSCELTGIWEKKLRDIEHKTYDPADFINGLKEQINKIVIDVLSDNSNRRVTIMTEEDLKKKPAAKKPAAKKPAARKAPASDPMVGKPCPLCGKGVIIKGKTAYGCSNWKAGCQYRQPFSQM